MKERYYSLDVFRGATVALMILVNNPGSWDHIFTPLDHAPWHGCTPTDLVFPFFLFAVGNALSFSLHSFSQKSNTFFIGKVLKRSILLFLLGLFLNWSPFFKWEGNSVIFKNWENVRIFGVLQRIAIAYLFASIIVFFFNKRVVMITSVLILLAYWLLCLFMGNPSDPFSLQGYFGTRIDLAILGKTHVYKGEGMPFDPEGLVSAMSAIVQVILGYLIGQMIQNKGKTYEMVTRLFYISVMLVVAGLMWDLVFPINKKIWTGSYTLYTSGLAGLTIACMIYLIEFKNKKGAWSSFFNVFGKNPLFIFVLSGFLPRLFSLIRIPQHKFDEKGNQIFLTPFSWLYENVFKNMAPDLRIGSLVYAVTLIFFYWLIVYFMDKKKIYIRV